MKQDKTAQAFLLLSKDQNSEYNVLLFCFVLLFYLCCHFIFRVINYTCWSKKHTKECKLKYRKHAKSWQIVTKRNTKNNSNLRKRTNAAGNNNIEITFIAEAQKSLNKMLQEPRLQLRCHTPVLIYWINLQWNYVYVNDLYSMHITDEL